MYLNAFVRDGRKLKIISNGFNFLIEVVGKVFLLNVMNQDLSHLF